MQTSLRLPRRALVCAITLCNLLAHGQGDQIKQDNSPILPPPPAEGYTGRLLPSAHGGPVGQVIASGWVNQTMDRVTRIVWFGGYTNWTDTQQPDGSPTRFVLTMWTNNPAEGLPAKAVWSVTGSVSSVESIGGATDLNSGSPVPFSLFRYEVLITYDQGFTPEPIIAPTYWLSIGSADPSDRPWCWFMRPHPWPTERPFSAVAVTDPTDPIIGSDYVSGAPISTELPYEGAYLLYATTPRTDDFGDAPDSYQTLLSNDGARHTVTSSLYIAVAPDLEGDGAPDSGALGDDQSGTDDEDYPAGLSNLVKGSTANLTIPVTGEDGRLSIWVDFNQNGDFQGFGEGVVASLAVTNGLNHLQFAVPADATEGSTYARLRISTVEGLSPNGSAPDGEVEDYAVIIEGPGLDFGDAPDGFPVTLAQDGARHVSPSPLYLGSAPDREMDGTVSAAADHDDTTGLDDEDGVAMIGSVRPGEPTEVELNASTAGLFSLWIDLDLQTNWNESTERIFNNIPVTAGLNRIQFTVPSDASTGVAIARARISTAVVFAATGEAPDGEVEDFPVTLTALLIDFGDAPTGFPVTLTANGARHRGPSAWYLGSLFDGEADGQPSALADGDDLAGIDDEDGVSFSGLLSAGGSAQLIVNASTAGVVSAWIDFDGNRSWADADNGIATNHAVTAGSNSVAFAIPVSANAGTHAVRVRFGSANLTSYEGEAQDGEVEDLLITIAAGGSPLDFGDAPTSFPVRLAQDGARHTVTAGVQLGALLDAESDGQPSSAANGDDTAASADEDGLLFIPSLLEGVGTTARVAVSTSGFLGAWLDVNSDGDWSDTGEYVWQATPVAAGTNSITLGPFSFAGGSVHALRIRFATNTLEIGQPTGSASNGEVEDYILNSTSIDWGDAPSAFPTAGTANGARHDGPSAIRLGTAWDGESDGQPSASADGDDVNGATDDEDGVTITALQPGRTSIVEVTASAGSWLNAWFDFNADNTWTGALEHVFDDVAVTAGVNRLTVIVPASVTAPVFARFRLSSLSGLEFAGPAGDGEVEDYRFALDLMDYGDASGFFPVLREENGARHAGPSAYFLGAAWDAEADGQPGVDANGDDVNGIDDEDGVTFLGGFVVGSSNLIRVVASTAGVLNAWMDFDGDGSWTSSASERVSADLPLAKGTNLFSIVAPSGALLGPSMARFRFASTGGLTLTGEASDGEVEDYSVNIQGQDFGDAPTNYPVTLSRNGARHLGPSSLQLGSAWDSETDGIANTGAEGDDITGSPDDEDGVVVVSPLVPGLTGTVRVVTTGAGFLNIWADLNRDGDWSDAGEQVLADQSFAAGTHDLAWPVPSGLAPGPVFTRFRLSTAAGLTVTGPAPDGEVEDHQLEVRTLDFGDAPTGFPVTLSQDGARHAGPSLLYLGPAWDAETNGVNSSGSDADDASGADDEDGVYFPVGVRANRTNQLIVTASASGYLSGWFDIDGSGSWTAGERLLTDVVLTAGTNEVSLVLPALTTSVSQARFRFSSVTGLTATGYAVDGEVEDHRLVLESYDFGDAPATFPVTIASNGARHVGPSAYYLGAAWDGEVDGAASSDARGDDLAGTDDEDGVTVPTPLSAGSTNTVLVTASTNGFLNVWCDFDGDGAWSSPAEQAVTDLPLAPGVNAIPLHLPTNIQASAVVARFRFTSSAGVGVDGTAADGEVEDHRFEVQSYDFGDAPAGYPVGLAQDGASHRGPSGYFLGALWDGEADGTSSSNADADDLGGLDDEDGVSLIQPLAYGTTNLLRIVASTSGLLNVWADLGRDGDWVALSDRVITERLLAKGTNAVPLFIPAGTATGSMIVRFRFTSTVGTGPTGPATDGEVEDYRFDVVGLDFGDAPSTFPVSLSANGARHVGPGPLFLGLAWDSETDGLTSDQADADDLTGTPDDEDGVQFPEGLIAGTSNRLQIIASTTGVFQLWADWDGNGTWNEAGEQVFSNALLATGLNERWVVAPASIEATRILFRARIASVSNLAVTGFAADGEVEDFAIPLSTFDFGDAPSGYPVTRLENGAMHRGPGPLRLGLVWDGETDGTPDTDSDSDDLRGVPDDEDGVSLPIDLRPGTVTNIVRVAATASGLLQVWVDLDRNGSWADSGEQVAVDTPVSAGVNEIQIPLPESISAGTLNARFRLSSVAGLGFTGEAPDGEVEDVRLGVTDSFTRDFGDAPAPYPTRLIDTGASHIVSTGLRLGTTIDVEVDGQPALESIGDDANGLPPDEDGVRLPIGWRIATATNVVLIASDAGLLHAWFDFNRDGDWSDPGEQVATDHPVISGTNLLAVTLPPETLVGPVFARFRLSTATGLTPIGVAPDGEVEDHMTIVTQTAEGLTEPQITGFDRVGGGMVVRINTISNGFYELQSTTELVEEPVVWQPRDRVRPAPLTAFTNSDAPATLEAFRVVAPYVAN